RSAPRPPGRPGRGGRKGPRGLPDHRDREAPPRRPRGGAAGAGAAGMSASGRLAAEATFELDDVLAATRGELAQLGDRIRFPGVTTDTRAIRPGELFVAIRGATHDGQHYLAEAYRRGEESRRPTPRRRHAQLRAVAGSNGKTTTKEMAAAILHRAFGADAVLHTHGTQNNLVGLPLTLLRLADPERGAVLELGMNGPGEVWRLAEIAAPDAGVITCVAPG